MIEVRLVRLTKGGWMLETDLWQAGPFFSATALSEWASGLRMTIVRKSD